MNAPAELKAEARWVVWRTETRDGKPTKVPYQAERISQKASSTDPVTWATFERAVSAFAGGRFDGVGFVLGDGYAGVDLDDCRDMSTGAVAPWAQRIVERLDSYTEVSPSGTGLKIFLRGSVTEALKDERVEIYTEARFFTLTGNAVNGLAIADRTAELTALHAEATEARDFRRWAKRRHEDKIIALWHGDWSGYPSQSEADLALCSHITRFCDGKGGTARMDSLFRLSGLFREKWLREDYRMGTITKALQSVLDEKRAQAREGGFHFTDLGNAERMVLRHGEDLRHCRTLGAWFVWDGRRWARDATGEIMRRAKETIRRTYDAVARIENPIERKKLVDHLLKSEADRGIKAMVSVAESEAAVAISADVLDPDPYLLNCRNGTVDLRTGRLQPHRREDMLSKLCPVEYDPAARSELWRQAIEWAIPDPDVRSFFQRAVGYTLVGETQEDKLFFAHGPTASAKSTVFESIKSALGDYAVTADFETFLRRRDVGNPRNDVARLAGARLVLSVEVEEGRRLAEGLIKTLTGGDTVAARFLYRESFEFRPTFTLWLVANHAPKVADDDDALWRRIVRIPFDHVLPKERRDPDVKATLRDPAVSGPAVLAWAVEGCLRWQREGLGVPPQIEAATEAYRAEMDPLCDFWEQFTLGPDAWTPAAQMREAYEAWARDSGEPRLLRPEQFATRLRARGCVPERRSGGTRVWRGIGLMTSDGGDGGDTAFGKVPL